MASREMLGLVDWHLLVLFVGLFVVNDADRAVAGCSAASDGWPAPAGIDLRQPGALFARHVVLSNLVSNVPAVMLLLPGGAAPPGRRGAGAGSARWPATCSSSAASPTSSSSSRRGRWA